jgi:hypothetical protein
MLCYYLITNKPHDDSYRINLAAGIGMTTENSLALKWRGHLKKKSPPPITAQGRGLRIE